MRIACILLLLYGCATSLRSQGFIDHIKNQEYLKYKDIVDCTDPADMLSARICANLAFQRADSTLTHYYYDALQVVDSVRLADLQKEWRSFRERHCYMAIESYAGGAGNLKYVIFLNCMTDVTNHRTEELKALLQN